jgi:hypothetical protein
MHAVPVRHLVVDAAWWPAQPHPADLEGLARAMAAGLSVTFVGPIMPGRTWPAGVQGIHGVDRDDAWKAWARQSDASQPGSSIACWLGDGVPWPELAGLPVLWTPSDAHPELLRRAHFQASRPHDRGALREVLDLWMTVHRRYAKDWEACPWAPQESGRD